MHDRSVFSEARALLARCCAFLAGAAAEVEEQATVEVKALPSLLGPYSGLPNPGRIAFWPVQASKVLRLGPSRPPVYRILAHPGLNHGERIALWQI